MEDTEAAEVWVVGLLMRVVVWRSLLGEIDDIWME